MKAFTILIKFNDGTNKCIKSFYTEKMAIDQFESIVKEEIKKYNKEYETYSFIDGSNKGIVYNGYFSCDQENEFIPICFEIIEQEIDSSIFDWKDIDEEPREGMYFVGKLKNKNEFVFGKIINSNGWITSSYFANNYNVDPYWDSVKNLIERWKYFV